jgi:hypothetical protein
MSSKGKNIVVLCDGTWSGQNSRTNVFVLANELIEKDYEQHFMYLDGVGIGEIGLDFIIDGAIALSLDRRIKQAYKFIVSHYNPGDDIWLFGFSRGAYTVRCVAGMIQNCGILKLDRVNQTDQLDQVVDLAYNIYRNRVTTFKPSGDGTVEFKKAFSYPESDKQPIKFLGLFETVGAHGIPAYVIGDGFRYLEFHDKVVPNVVRYARQASAIHERVSVLEACPISSNSKSTVNIKECWFPGLHTEIGGGTSFIFGGNERISKATLLWIIENIVEVGGLLMKDTIENYRSRFSPDTGPSWNLGTIIVDRSSALIPAILHRDRKIPLEVDPENPNTLKRDLLYRNGDWTVAFGNRNNLSRQYHSNTYENLRKEMEKEGIKLDDNIKYDK